MACIWLERQAPKMIKKYYEKAPWMMFGVFTLLALLILWPLLGRGFILTLDMVFTPELRMPLSTGSSFLLQALLHSLNFVLPSDVIEKLVMFAILYLSGAGMYQLFSYTYEIQDTYQKIGAYFAGLIYMVNPFTYDRFMAGQYNLLLGYAILPWFTRALLIFFSDPNWRATVVVATWASISGIVSIHSVGFMLILAAVLMGVHLWKNRTENVYLHKVWKLGLMGVILFLLASSYWLAPLVLGHSNQATALNSFGIGDQSAFATLGSDWFWRAINVLRLQGFWLEVRHMYFQPQYTVPLWWLLSLFIWALVVLGIVTIWLSRQRTIIACFGISAAIATFLAMGLFNSWLAANIPLFAGYREPEKFVALVALCIVMFMSYGVATTARYVYSQGGVKFLIGACFILFLLPVVWTPTIWWGFNKQLSPVRYPADWFIVNRQLNADHQHYQTLFLPWHLYMYFGFAGRIIANPAPAFFDKPVIVSDNPEYRGSSRANSTYAKRTIDLLLPTANVHNSLGAQLAKLNIKYIILDKDDDFSKYAYLHRQLDLKPIANDGTLEVYVNEAWGNQ